MSTLDLDDLIAEARAWIQVGYLPPPSYKGRNGVQIMDDMIRECRELRERLGAALVSEQRAKEMALSQGDAQVRMALEWTNMERRAEKAEAEVARLKVFVSRHTDGSCTNPLCDCVEAKLHRAQATVERVRAYAAATRAEGGALYADQTADELDAALEAKL